ncbi:hypothetical protein [Ferroglobus placidus]|nr:hypothetical protein [Ferroglobus placidus]
MNGKVLIAFLATITLVAFLIPFFADVAKEEIRVRVSKAKKVGRMFS